MTRLIYREDAAADVRDAYQWYENQRSGLGEEFLSALGTAENAILESPSAFRVLRRYTRRYLLNRFPYQLLYRIVDDIIVVVACFHVRRSPRAIRSRDDG